MADAVYITAFSFAGIVSWEITIVLLIGSYLTSYIRSRSELAAKGTFKLDIGILERAERIIGIFLALLAYILTEQQVYEIGGNIFNAAEVIMIILIILSYITVFQRLQVSYSRLKEYDKAA